MRKTVIITGTTSGIGEAFTHEFAKSGVDLILIARDKEKLEQQKENLKNTYGVFVTCIPQDLSTHDAAKIVYQKIKELGKNVDYLVNNAGFNVVGEFVQTPINKELEMLYLHICFFTEFTKYILQDMVQRKEGRVLNVASTGSYISTPHDAVYSATKAYMLSFSNALSAELTHSGVSITTICPGSTNTEFAKKAEIEKSILFQLFVMNPQDVVSVGYKSMLKGKRTIIVGIYNKLLVLFSKITPKFILSPLTMWMMRKEQKQIL